MTGRLKVYDADTATWKYVDAAGGPVTVTVQRYVPIDPNISLSTLGPATSVTANTGAIHTPVLSGLPVGAIAVSLGLHARHSVVTASNRFNIYPYGSTRLVAQLITGKVVNHYEALTVFYVPLGGDRQFDYEVQIGTAGTTVFDFYITGYWVEDTYTVAAG